MKSFFMAFSIFSLFFLCSCGQKENNVQTANKKAFESAIGKYCKAHSYGMKIKSFESILEKGSEATAVCKMEEAEGLYNMSVKWTFSLAKNESGEWEVKSHIAK
jgi:alanine racemase